MTSLIVDFPNRNTTTSSSNSSGSASVRFSETSEMVFFERHSKSNVTDIWYSGRDLEAMKLENKDTIRNVHKRLHYLSLSSDNESTKDFAAELDFFGIESMLSPRLIKKKIACRSHYLRAVLEEQARQDVEGECDPYRLAAVAQRSSRWATGRATEIGSLQSLYHA